MFGISRFHQLTGATPKKVTVVSWGFKSERFQFHANTIQFPSERFVFSAANDPPDLDGAKKGEQKALKQFSEAPLGISKPLIEKKRGRTFGDRKHGYECYEPLAEVVSRIEDAVEVAPSLSTNTTPSCRIEWSF